MKIRNYNNPPVGNDEATRIIVRHSYRVFRKAGHSPMASRLYLRSLLTMGEVRGIHRYITGAVGPGSIKGE